MTLLLRSNFLSPVAPPPPGRAAGENDDAVRLLVDGLLEVDEHGRIVALGPARDASSRARSRAERIDDAVILPGLVDAHLHFPQTRVLGRSSGALLDWLERTVYPEELRFRDPSYAREVAGEFVSRLLEMGTTTACVFSSSHHAATHALFEELHARGLRAVVGMTWMDVGAPAGLTVQTTEALDASRALVARWHGRDRGRLRYAVSPRFAVSCSPGMLGAAAGLAREHGLLLQTHLAENATEGEAALTAHPQAADYLGIYEGAGLLDRRTLLAHACHLNAAAWDRVARAGACVVHCPDSNAFLGSGTMPLRGALDRGVRVALGTDVGAGRSFSLRRVVSAAYDTALSRGERVAPAELLRLATLGGAEALGLERELGTLEPGKDADLAVFPLPAGVSRTRDAVIDHLAFATDRPEAGRVYVRGARLR